MERLDKLEREQQQQERRKPKEPTTDTQGSSTTTSSTTSTSTSPSSSALSVESLEDDTKSLLEIVSQSLFEYVTTRLTPRTDRACRWSYSQAKCVPKCQCKYQFQLGDYTLSRSCRLNPNATEVAACDPAARDESDDNMLVKCVARFGFFSLVGASALTVDERGPTIHWLPPIVPPQTK